LEDEFRKVNLIKTETTEDGKKFAYFKVGGDCNLGIDPSDPNSNASNSLNRIINEAGFAFPITGGMSH
jgi:hypothetical protein